MIAVEFYEQGMGEEPLHVGYLEAVPRAGEVVTIATKRHRVIGVIWGIEVGRQEAEIIVERLETPEEETARLERERAAKGRRGSEVAGG